jgi:hypothetical protein
MTTTKITTEAAEFDGWGTLGAPFMRASVDKFHSDTVFIEAVDGADTRGRTTFTQMLDGDAEWIAVSHKSGDKFDPRALAMMMGASSY